jgi:hypothetical protein
MKPSFELKSLFKELVGITADQTGRRDWAIIRWRNTFPFNRFGLIDLMK